METRSLPCHDPSHAQSRHGTAARAPYSHSREAVSVLSQPHQARPRHSRRQPSRWLHLQGCRQPPRRRAWRHGPLPVGLRSRCYHWLRCEQQSGRRWTSALHHRTCHHTCSAVSCAHKHTPCCGSGSHVSADTLAACRSQAACAQVGVVRPRSYSCTSNTCHHA